MAATKPSPERTKLAIKTLATVSAVLDRVARHDLLSDLSVRACRIFFMIYETGKDQEPCSIKSLAAHLEIPKPSVSRAVTRLETLHMVKRSVGPSQDRRYIVVQQTAAGLAMYYHVAGI